MVVEVNDDGLGRHVTGRLRSSVDGNWRPTGGDKGGLV
jgi:hypothetical protein